MVPHGRRASQRQDSKTPLDNSQPLTYGPVNHGGCTDNAQGSPGPSSQPAGASSLSLTTRAASVRSTQRPVISSGNRSSIQALGDSPYSTCMMACSTSRSQLAVVSIIEALHPKYNSHHVETRCLFFVSPNRFTQERLHSDPSRHGHDSLSWIPNTAHSANTN